MAFSDFTFPQVQQDLGLVVEEADLFSPVPPIPLREDFVTTLTGVTPRQHEVSGRPGEFSYEWGLKVNGPVRSCQLSSIPAITSKLGGSCRMDQTSQTYSAAPPRSLTRFCAGQRLAISRLSSQQDFPWS